MYLVSYLLLSQSIGMSVPTLSKPSFATEHLIGHYLLSQKLVLKNSRNAIALVNASLLEAEEVVPKWPVQIFNKGPMRELVRLHTRFEHAIIFLRDLKDLNTTSRDFLDQPSVWFSEMQYHFIILNCRKISLKAIQVQAELLWRHHRLVNYRIAVLQPSKGMQVFSYNPGEDRLYNNTGIANSKMDTVKNLKGCKIAISVVTLGPKEAVYEHNECTQGRLCRMLNGFLRYINAGSVLVVPKANISMMFRISKKLVIDGQVDISFGTHWLREDHLMYSTFSAQQAAVVGMVPRAKLRPMLLNVLYIYDIYIWSLIVCLHIFFRLALNYYKVFLEPSLKLVLLSSYVFSIYFQSTFQGAVITALTSPKFEREIDTVDDLMMRGLTVYGEDDWAFLLSSKLKLTHMSYFDQGLELWTTKARHAYLLTDYWAKEFLLTQASDGSFFSNYYHIMAEPIGMGRITFYIRRNSPLREVFNTFLCLVNDYGLNLIFGAREFRFTSETAVQTLTLQHFHGAFVPLFCGLALATLVFLVELFWKQPSF